MRPRRAVNCGSHLLTLRCFGGRILMPSRPVRITLIVVIATVALIAGAWLWWRSAQRPGRPHVVLISIDTLRADHLGCYGHPGPITPNIDRLAGDGVRFASVTTPAPLTLPGHATMLTGRIPPSHGVHKNSISRSPQ